MNTNFLDSLTNFLKKRTFELLGLILVLSSVALAIAFTTYSPEDPSFVYGDRSYEIQNFFGIYGSSIADFLFDMKTGKIKYYLVSRSNPKIPGSSRWKLTIDNINDQQPGLVFCESNSLDDLSLIKSSIKNEFLEKGKKIIDRFDDMKNIASSRLEDWLEEDEDINQNLDFKQKSFYNDDISVQSFSDKKEDDPWI